MILKSICVFCGASRGKDAACMTAASEFGRLVVHKGYQLVYGGGSTGLMGAVADGALEAGGEVIGIIPVHLAEREVGHRGLTELITVSNMHERKTKMAELADAVVALPGGAGTLEEIMEQWTWMQLGLHQKPLAFLNTDGFYDPLFDMITQMVSKGFMRKKFADAAICESDPAMLIQRISAPHSLPS